MSTNVGNFGDSGEEQLKRRLDGVPLPNYATPAHADDLAVDRFAAAMKATMAASRAKGRGGWDDPAQCPVERLQTMLLDHLAKGDPVDVGNFAMMLHQRGASVAAPAAQEPAGWRDFLVRLSNLEGSMVNGNRLSRAAKDLFEAQPETWKVLPSPAADEWISVEDRLPEPKTIVLLTVHYENQGEDDDGNWHATSGAVIDFGQYVGPEHGGYIEAFASPHGQHEYISHWKPLPAPASIPSAPTGELKQEAKETK